MQQSQQLKRNSVSSGSYIISKEKKEVLNAYLGTCVGVAICDQHHGVGGLIHLLLAEPTAGSDTMFRPENYALTGLPLFISELYKKGAEKGHLEATVAGGVLVGPVSKMDINLDIGGRTTEVVEKILKNQGIPIANSETGGYLGCCLSLNLSNWESRIDPISMPDESNEIDFIKPNNMQFEKAILAVRPIPQIVIKIIRMLHDDTIGIRDLAIEVRQEQVMTAKILRLCNTAFFRQFFQHRGKVESIDRALFVLGEKQLLQMAISALMNDFFPRKSGGYSLCKGGMFYHSLGTAMICEKLAHITGLVSDDIAYTAGLLHDIGKIVLDQYMCLAYPLFYRKIRIEDEDLINLEREIFGITHTELGGLLAEKWSIPEQIAEAIKYHHTPEYASLNPELTHIVYLADLILSRFMVGAEFDRLNTDDFGMRLIRIGLSIAHFPAIIEKLSKDLSALSLLKKSKREAVTV